ncbi:MAG: hypothetical protein ACO1SV_09305 [Fimbriimonas sp.]
MPAAPFVLFAVLGSGSAGMQGMDAKVTYTMPGASATKILKDLSEKSGIGLETSPGTANDVLAVRLEAVSMKEALAKIAWAVGGSWRKEGETYRLVRTAEEARAEWARERDKEIEGYTRSLATSREALAKAGEFTPEKAEALAKEAAVAIARFDPTRRNDQGYWNFTNKLSTQSPSGRAMARIMALLTPAELADLPKGIKVVYSTRPTRMQRPLGAEVAGVVAALQREQSLWIEATTKHNVKNPTFGNSTYIVDGLSDGDSPIERVGKVLLTVTRSRYTGSGIRLELLVGDVKGRVIARGNGHVGAQTAPATKPPETSKTDPKIVRSGDAEAIALALVNRPPKPLPEELRQRLLNPETHEPLGIIGGASILQLGVLRKANMVVALNENAFFTGIYGAKEIPAAVFLHNMRVTNEVKEEAGWITARPIAAASSRQVRIDRRLLGQYLRRKASGVAMRVEEKASWAFRLPLEEEAPLPRTIVSMVAPGDMGERYGSGDGRLLRFFGSLTTSQRAAARQGMLRMGQLTEGQAGMVREMLYGEYAYLQPDYQKAQEAKIDMNQFYNGLMREPTECLPDGIPPDGTLNITEQTDEVAFTTDQETQGYVRPSQGFTPEQLAWQQFSQSRPDLFPYMSEPYQRVDLSRVRLGKRTTYMILLQFTPLLAMHHGLEDRDYGASQTIAFDRLPTEFRKKVDLAVENYRKSYANATPGQRTPTTTHTPPP